MSHNKNYVYDANHEFTTPIKDGEQVKGVSTNETYVTIAVDEGNKAVVREIPSQEGGVVTTVESGQRFPLEEEKEGWVKVKIDDKSGWIFGALVEIEK